MKPQKNSYTLYNRMIQKPFYESRIYEIVSHIKKRKPTNKY